MVYRDEEEFEKLLVSDKVEKLFDGEDYDRGELETLKKELAESNAYNLVLTRLLIKKKVITLKEAVKLCSDAQLF